MLVAGLWLGGLIVAELDVIGFGSLCVDFIFKVKGYPRRGSTNLSSASLVCCGGIIGNFLVGCSRLGLKCGVIGVVGADHYGGMIIDCLTNAGIDTSMLVIDSSGSTAKVVCIVDDRGERTFIVDPGVQASVTLPNGVESYVSKCRVFHTDCLDVGLAVKLLSHARSNGVTTSVDLGTLAEHMIHGINEKWVYEVLRHCDIAFISEANAKKVFRGLKPIEVLDKILKCGVKTAVLTLGRRGCIVVDGGEVCRVRAFKVEVVDTTGAGDAFEAGFLYSIIKGLRPIDAAIVGNAVAALKCKKLGGQLGLPSIKEVVEFLDSKGLSGIASLIA